jgi:hypothetical protein
MLGGCAVTFAHFLMFSVSSSAHGPYGAGLPWLAVLPVQGYLTVRAAPAFFSSERSPAAKEKEREEPSLAHWWSLSRLRHR